jgi:hypothetical protein
MLNLQAIFERKATDYPVWDCVIDKIVELPEPNTVFQVGSAPGYALYC